MVFAQVVIMVIMLIQVVEIVKYFWRIGIVNNLILMETIVSYAQIDIM
jgi:hypothetical protein